VQFAGQQVTGNGSNSAARSHIEEPYMALKLEEAFLATHIAEKAGPYRDA
jgi:hypothetical protein